MAFSKRTNCKKCGFPLHLQDLKSKEWEGEDEKFVFECSACNEQNVIKSSLFIDDHLNISKDYLAIVKEDREYLPSELFEKIIFHIENCEECRNRLNEKYLTEIENKIKSNERTLSFFEKNSLEIMEKLEAVNTIENGINQIEIYQNAQSDVYIRRFSYKDNIYELNEDDEFFRKQDDDLSIQRLYYYIRQDVYLSGMVSFYIKNGDICLERIWFRTLESMAKEKEFIQELKDGKIKIKLETISRIFKFLNQKD